MTTTTLLENLASYVPRLVMHGIAENPTPISEPMGRRFPAAVLLADISGFTALTERLARRGPEGVEDLSNILNAYFGQLIDVVLDHNGDIVEFTGDGIIVLWETSENEDLTMAVLRAAHCGMAVQHGLEALSRENEPTLTLRVSVGAGEVLMACVGGILGRWELLVAGNPLVQVGATAHWAHPGDVVLSPAAWELVHNQCTGHLLPENGGARLEAVHQRPARPELEPIPLKPEMIAAMRVFLPGIILNRLEAGLSDWLAELRCLTVVFVKVDSLNYHAPDALEQSHAVMLALQKALYQYEGSVNQFIVDDKGTIFVAAMGLPPITHEDDAVRGVQAALAMHAHLRALGYPCAIGLSTGWAFCGARGNRRRRDYAMIGDVVNLAARLMQAAEESRDDTTVPVLCDFTTMEATTNRLAFEPLPPIKVKGKSEPVAVYRPLGRELVTVRRHTAIIGRSAERALLASSLHALQNEQQSGVVIIEGDTGMGKSRLITDMVQQAQSRGLSSLMGLGNAVERSTSYHAWRPIFAQIFDMDTLSNDPQARRRRVLERLWIDRDIARLAPLMNAVLPVDIPENDITAHMSGQVRAFNTRRLLVRVLRMAVSLQPTLLILDEAHWLDSASWALALDVAQHVEPILLVIATRPLADPLPPEYNQLVRRPDTQRIVLDRLTTEETVHLLCQRLGVNSIPTQVSDFILEKSQGNPFFSEELAYALRDAGLITIVNDECRLVTSAEDLTTLNFPASVQGVVISRIDRLMPSQQLMLKVASVIGYVFALHPLQAIYPLEPERPRLADYLNVTERLNITTLETTEPQPTYIFKHIIIQEIVYHLLLFSQRRDLHRALAEWYEQTYADELAPLYPILAHHWHKAEVLPKVVDYLEKAGDQALHVYANQEAVRFFGELLDLADQEPEAVIQGHTDISSKTTLSPFDVRCASWERKIGEAYLNLGQLAESRQHLERAVALLKRPVPTRRRKLTVTMLRQAMRQTMHRLRRVWHGEQAQPHNLPMLEVARAYEALLNIYYFANETLAAIYTSLLTLNLAERAGPSSELARAYANMCITTGSLALHPLAEAYSRQAIETAQQVDDLTTQAYVLNASGLYRVGVGKWQDARLALEQAVDICDRLGDRRRWGTNWTLLAQIAYYEGDFARSDEMFAQLHDEAQRGGDVLQQAWAMGGQGQNALRLGRLEYAARLLEQANVALAENKELPSQISNDGLLAMVHLRRGDLAEARQAARAAARLLADVPVPASYYLIEGYAGLAEVYLALWEASRGQLPAERAALARQARQACDALAHFARIFPIGQPRMLLWQGLYTWLEGRPRRAHQTWHNALAAASDHAMPYEQALAHYEIGRHSTGAARREHLAQAAELCARLGAACDLDRVERLRQRA